MNNSRLIHGNSRLRKIGFCLTYNSRELNANFSYNYNFTIHSRVIHANSR